MLILRRNSKGEQKTHEQGKEGWEKIMKSKIGENI